MIKRALSSEKKTILTQLTVLGQSERVQIPLDIQNHRKLGATANLDDGRSTVADARRRRDHRRCVADAALAALVVAARVHRSAIYSREIYYIF